MSDKILDNLLAALPIIAKTTGGYATVTDLKGKRIRTVDSNGKEIVNWKGLVFPLAEEAAQKQTPLIGSSQIEVEADTWVLPLGDYVLGCSNVERMDWEKQLIQAIEQALPLIAKVVGGEAVLFDKDGIRLSNYDADGHKREDKIGVKSDDANRAMKLHKPIIGRSNSVSGATAVRIPITTHYGIGFNDEKSVRKKQKLYDEVKKLQVAKYNFNDIIGHSHSIRQVKDTAKNISQGNSSVLLFGETGTGKELFAQSLHNFSNRKMGPFVAINCGALPASLIESNLFGYEKGAFTGAKKEGHKGIFEQAHGGTIFLDEISEMELHLQTKLLRVLQEREVIRIGGTKAIPIDVRVIASTNRDLSQSVEQQKFRQDLYYRLNVVQLVIPPLRNRIQDIPELVTFFMGKYNTLLGRYVYSISKKAINQLLDYSWPGNIRELQNCVEYAINVMKPEETEIDCCHLPSYINNDCLQEIDKIECISSGVKLKDILRNTEKSYISKVLNEVQGQKKQAAEKLGISTTTLWRRMVELDIKDE